MTYERKTEAQRHKLDAHAALKLNLKIAREAMELVQDWERSWPNDITNFDLGIESTINDIRVFQRQVQPPTVESDPHDRASDPIMPTESFDEAERRIIRVQDD